MPFKGERFGYAEAGLAGESRKEVRVVEDKVLARDGVLRLQVHLDHSGHGRGVVIVGGRRPGGTGDIADERLGGFSLVLAANECHKRQGTQYNKQPVLSAVSYR